MHNTKMKVATRNNLLRKLSNSKWGANTSTIRTTALALCYSVAEYAAPVWARSSHAQKLNTELNIACRAVTGCLKPTNIEDPYLMAGIAPPNIRRDVCARVEKTKQETNEAHSLYGQNPAERRLVSRNCFLRSVKPADFPPKVIRCSAWLRRLQAIPHRATVNIDENLAKGFDRPWTTWRCLNRLRTGFTCSKEQRQRWRYYEGDTTCECGLATENTAHMMQCTLLEQPCSLDDLNKFNDTAKKCVERWNTSLMTRRRRQYNAHVNSNIVCIIFNVNSARVINIKNKYYKSIRDFFCILLHIISRRPGVYFHTPNDLCHKYSNRKFPLYPIRFASYTQ